MEQQLPLGPPQHTDLRPDGGPVDERAAVGRLPYDLGQAMAAAAESDFVRNIITPGILQQFLAAKQEEWRFYQQSADKQAAEDELYFGVY